MTNWRSLRKFFRDVFDHPRCGFYAREMHALVVELRKVAALKAADIQADYLYLTIKLPDCECAVIIFSSRPRHYSVRLYHGGWGGRRIDSKRNVSLHALRPLIHHFLNRMAAMQPSAA